MLTQAASQSNTKLLVNLMRMPAAAARSRLSQQDTYRAAGLNRVEMPPMMLDPLEPEDLVLVSVDRWMSAAVSLCAKELTLKLQSLHGRC
jgi:hypothetical protein